MKQTVNYRIAVIGGGVAGLTAAYLLHRDYEITLFEKSERIGGNAYTLVTSDGEEVDIAVAVFGKYSYKNLFTLFKKLHIDTVGPSLNPCEGYPYGAGFSDLDSGQGLFLTPGIRGMISQHFEILKPYHVKSMLRFMEGLKQARTLLRRGDLAGLTVEEALEIIPQFSGDAKLVLISCLCLISSMHCDAVLDAPAGFFFEKLGVHHDFVPPKALFSVRLPKKRTKNYVEALSAGFRDRIIFKADVKTIIRRDGCARVLLADGKELLFDKVVFACNADQALHLLQEPTEDEKRLLGAWKYSEGRIVVHRDHSHFPKKELMEGFTFLYHRTGRYIETSVSGSLWVLPGVSKGCNLVSTQHPNFPIREDHIIFEKVFRTPIFDFQSCGTIRELPSLNGVNNTYYCGSHFGFGLHEDAVTSAIEVAKKLGVDF
jgi:predicted NAD/FAD-binding protein